jgi:hypothetical protein
VETQGGGVSARRVFMVLVAAAALVVGPAAPSSAEGGAVQKKTVGGKSGRSGAVIRYAERRDGRTITSVTMSAHDADGRGGRCTETWIDYRTKPHQHLNPGMLINCSGGRRGVSGAVATDYPHVAGMSVIVCEVPDTSGRITRDASNCRGGLGAMSLHSGQRYDQFRSNGDRSPGGVRMWRV